MPRFASRRYCDVMPIIAPRFHVASSNLPTYHMTFMCPMWSQCHWWTSAAIGDADVAHVVSARMLLLPTALPATGRPQLQGSRRSGKRASRGMPPRPRDRGWLATRAVLLAPVARTRRGAAARSPWRVAPLPGVAPRSAIRPEFALRKAGFLIRPLRFHSRARRRAPVSNIA